MECDSGWTCDPPLPIGQKNGLGQQNPASCGAVAGSGTSGSLYCGEDRQLRFYPGNDGERNNGDLTGEHIDWTTPVARITFGTGV